MRSTTRPLLGLLAILAVVAPAADCQTVDSEPNPIAAALLEVVKDARAEVVLRQGIKLEPRAIAPNDSQCETRWAREREDHEVLGIAKAVGAAVGRTEDVFVCETDKGPPGCRLHAADLLIAASDPLEEDGLTTVFATARFHTGSERQPVAYRIYRVRLRSIGETWEVVDFRTMVTS